uniref:Secreted peptide n=1 Tax=Romanomermis culicivorax TaxID=13658 RepID=A0A915KDF3_ROMCU
MASSAFTISASFAFAATEIVFWAAPSLHRPHSPFVHPSAALTATPVIIFLVLPRPAFVILERHTTTASHFSASAVHSIFFGRIFVAVSAFHCSFFAAIQHFQRYSIVVAFVVVVLGTTARASIGTSTAPVVSIIVVIPTAASF